MPPPLHPTFFLNLHIKKMNYQAEVVGENVNFLEFLNKIMILKGVVALLGVLLLINNYSQITNNFMYRYM